MELQMLAPSQYVSIKDDPTKYYYLPLLGWMYRNRVVRCVSMLPDGDNILEVGYGSGVAFLNLSEKYKEIHGIDPHNKISEVKNSFNYMGLNLHLRKGSVLSLPYEDNTFDSAIAISIHEHLKSEEQQTAFSEIRRVLKPGGCYVVGVPGMNPLMIGVFHLMGWNIRNHHFCSEKQVLTAMQAVLDVDAATYSPRFWPRSLTTYLCIRGWKH